MTAVSIPQWTGVLTLLPSTTGDLSYIREVGAALDLLGDLQQNWDGEGGTPIPQHVLSVAGELLLPLARFQPPVPRIAPVLGGGIQFEWNISGRELEIEILPDGSVEYLTAEGPHVQEGGLPELPTQEVKSLVQWVMGRQ